MRTIIIVAMTPDRIIGHDGGMPWHEPADLRHFKQTTTGHAIIMGRKTFDSIGRPLPKRRNLVITRSPDSMGAPSLPGVGDGCTATKLDSSTSLDFVSSLDAALALCQDRDESIAFVMGGAQIYILALPIADEIIVTRIDRPGIHGDTHFPEWDERDWTVEPVATDSGLTITCHVRRSSAP